MSVTLQRTSEALNAEAPYTCPHCKTGLRLGTSSPMGSVLDFWEKPTEEKIAELTAEQEKAAKRKGELEDRLALVNRSGREMQERHRQRKQELEGLKGEIRQLMRSTALAEKQPEIGYGTAEQQQKTKHTPVSYTHLTLPTICSV